MCTDEKTVQSSKITMAKLYHQGSMAQIGISIGNGITPSRKNIFNKRDEAPT